MRPLSAAELLGAWEQGRAQTAVERSLALLAAACPGATPEALGQLSIGQRDARLLTLREWTFGPQLIGVARCGQCGEYLELAFSTGEIRALPEVEPAGTLALEAGGYQVHFRLPNSFDLLAIAATNDAAAARQALFERCLLAARRTEDDGQAAELPTVVVDAVAEQMARADPQADVQLALSCPACGHAWRATFDIAAFFWSEIGAWAGRILREVHSLAAAYGWSEAEILALSPWRRQVYLEMVGV